MRRAATVLTDLGLRPEQRLLMVVADSPEFVTLYLAAMRIGAVPVPVSTMLPAADIAELLRDSRAPLFAFSPSTPRLAGRPRPRPELRALLARPTPAHQAAGAPAGCVAATAARTDRVYETTADSPAFWLYTSGTTGMPKGAMHRHGSVRVVCETYGAQVLGIRPDDRCLSAAKAFFAYGLGNSVLFPLSVGAAAVLEPAPSAAGRHRRRARRVRRDAVLRRPDVLRQHAAGRPAGRRAGRRAAGRVGRRGAAGRAVPAVDRRTSAWTSSTASA